MSTLYIIVLFKLKKKTDKNFYYFHPPSSLRLCAKFFSLHWQFVIHLFMSFLTFDNRIKKKRSEKGTRKNLLPDIDSRTMTNVIKDFSYRDNVKVINVIIILCAVLRSLCCCIYSWGDDFSALPFNMEFHRIDLPYNSPFIMRILMQPSASQIEYTFHWIFMWIKNHLRKSKKESLIFTHPWAGKRCLVVVSAEKNW